jgi:hypothetical protein
MIQSTFSRKTQHLIQRCWDPEALEFFSLALRGGISIALLEIVCRVLTLDTINMEIPVRGQPY